MIALGAIYYKDQLGEECMGDFPGGFTSSPPIGLCLAKLSHEEGEKGQTKGEAHIVWSSFLDIPQLLITALRPSC